MEECGWWLGDASIVLFSSLPPQNGKKNQKTWFIILALPERLKPPTSVSLSVKWGEAKLINFCGLLQL